MEAVNFLLDRPIALFIVLAIGAAIGIVFDRVTQSAERERRKAYWRGRNGSKRAGGVVPVKSPKRARPILPPTDLSRSAASVSWHGVQGNRVSRYRRGARHRTGIKGRSGETCAEKVM